MLYYNNFTKVLANAKNDEEYKKAMKYAFSMLRTNNVWPVTVNIDINLIENVSAPVVDLNTLRVLAIECAKSLPSFKLKTRKKRINELTKPLLIELQPDAILVKQLKNPNSRPGLFVLEDQLDDVIKALQLPDRGTFLTLNRAEYSTNVPESYFLRLDFTSAVFFILLNGFIC